MEDKVGKKKASGAKSAAEAAALALSQSIGKQTELDLTLESLEATIAAVENAQTSAEKAQAIDQYWKATNKVRQSNVDFILACDLPYDVTKKALVLAGEINDALKAAGNAGAVTKETAKKVQAIADTLKGLASKAIFNKHNAEVTSDDKSAVIDKFVGFNESLVDISSEALMATHGYDHAGAVSDSLSGASMVPSVLKNMMTQGLAESELTKQASEAEVNAQKLKLSGVDPATVNTMSMSELNKAVKELESGEKVNIPKVNINAGGGPTLTKYGFDGKPIKPKPGANGKVLPEVKSAAGYDVAAEPRTQKRAGIEALKDLEPKARELAGGTVYIPQILATLSPLRGDFAANRAWLEAHSVLPDPFHRLFFRPCPKVPRHGFVDSRVCTTWEEIEELYNETLKADPEAEVIVMSELRAVSSAVATGTMVAVGPGNDGATSGRDTVVFDLHSKDIEPQIAKAARLKGEEGYIEAVYDGDFTYIVQLRGGPKIGKAQPRMVPRPVPAVREIVQADGDLLAWEGKMAALKNDHGGTVVWSPGGSVLSHYAVHALLNGVAISFEKEPPQVGHPFDAPPGASAVKDWDRAAIARGAARALVEAKTGRLSDKKGLSFALTFAATGIHSAMSLRDSASAEMLGGASMTLLMLAAAACCGESRHNGNVRIAADVPTERHMVFVRCLADYLASRPLLRLALDSFAGDDWGSSYGGIKWANCAANAIDLEQKLFEVIRGEGNVGDVVQYSHRLLNAVHNGGKLLNKFGHPMILDIAASGSRTFAVQSALWWHSVAHGNLRCSDAQLSEAVIRIRAAGAVESECFPLWNSQIGRFTGSSNPEAGGVKYTLANGRAQIRVLDQKSATLKIQYIFEVKAEMPKDAPPSTKQAALASKFKNLGIAGSSKKQQQIAGSGSYTSITVVNKPLLDLMVKQAVASGGLEQASSMAGSSTPYVKAHKAEPLGDSQEKGVRIYFGSEFVEVNP